MKVKRNFPTVTLGLQWGNLTIPNDTNATFTYPVAVSTVMFASCSPATGGIGGDDTTTLSVSNTNCTFHNASGRLGKVFVLVVGLA